MMSTQCSKHVEAYNKLYNTQALPFLLPGRETWTIKASDARRITAVEMKCMRRTAGYTWDRLQNKCTNCKGVKNNTHFWTNCWNTREAGCNM